MTKRRYKAQSNIDSFIFLYTTRKLTNTVLKYQQLSDVIYYILLCKEKEVASNITISYDANGNIKTYKDKTFTYDFLNRLRSVKQNGTTLATYTYDASNRRVSKTVSNKTITYLYHNNQVVQEYENDTLTNTYIYGKYLDDPIAYDLKNVLYYYLKDSRYSIQAIINSNSTVVESYSYSPFGILTMYDVNQNVISNSNVNNTITFTGRVYDSESNLYYYRNRMYSPELARFISKDPKGYVDGMNLYAYVKNNPLKYLDPMGTTVRDSRSDDYDVVDYIENITMSGGSNNGLLLMLQASEMAKNFIESENVQSMVNDPSNRFVSNNNTQVFESYISNSSIVTESNLIKVKDSNNNPYLPNVVDTINTSIGIVASASENMGKEFNGLNPSAQHILGVGGKVVGKVNDSVSIITSTTLYDAGKNVAKVTGGVIGGALGGTVGGIGGGVMGVFTANPFIVGTSTAIGSVTGAVIGGYFGGEYAGEIYDQLFK